MQTDRLLRQLWLSWKSGVQTDNLMVGGSNPSSKCPYAKVAFSDTMGIDSATHGCMDVCKWENERPLSFEAYIFIYILFECNILSYP